MSALVLKIKTSLNDDIRLFKGKFSSLKDAFNELNVFIGKAYQLNNSVNYTMQYKDDENDLVTIASELDLQDAIEQAKDIGKSVKIFIKIKNDKAKPKAKPVKPDIQSNNNNNDNKDDDVADDENNTSGLSGVLCDDLCNNEGFKKEFISFLRTTVLLYQNNTNNGNNRMDLTSCIVASLSQHSMIAEHKQIKEITSKMNFIIPQIEMFVSGILYNFDVKNIEIMVNKFVENKRNGINSCNMFQSMGLGFPFMMFGNMFNGNNMFEAKNCPGKCGLKFFKTPHASFTCDGCGQRMNQGSPMFGCRTCDYDLCTQCHNNNNNGFGTFQQGFGNPFMQSFGVNPMFGGCGFGNQFRQGFGNPCGPGFGGGYGRRCGGKFGRRHGRRSRHGHGYGHGYSMNNNDNNNNNNDVKDEGRFKADVIENPMPKISGNVVDPNQGIMKTWKIKNTGTKALPKGLMVKYSGRNNNPMVSTEQFYVGNDNEIKPNEEFTVTICIKTPECYGRFSSNWRLCTPDGKKFGQKLPFYLVLSPPQIKVVNNNNNNNNNEQKSDDNLRDSEVDELTSKVVNLVAKERNNDNDNNDEINIDVKKVNNDNDNKNNNDNDNDNADDVDMEINDSDDDNDDNAADVVDEPEAPKPQEPKPEAVEEYEYAKELNEFRSMGFDNDEYIKGLLNAKKGNIEEVVNALFQQ